MFKGTWSQFFPGACIVNGTAVKDRTLKKKKLHRRVSNQDQQISGNRYVKMSKKQHLQPLRHAVQLEMILLFIHKYI